MLICLPWKGSGGGVVYGFGVLRVKSWVKNVLNANKYIAIFSIKWGWSRLTYLPLVVIIFEKSIILFYWTPYRGIDTTWTSYMPWAHTETIEPLIGGLIHKGLCVPPGSGCWGTLTIEPLIGGIDTTLREWEIRNEQWTITFLGWTGEAGLHLITHC